MYCKDLQRKLANAGSDSDSVAHTMLDSSPCSPETPEPFQSASQKKRDLDLLHNAQARPEVETPTGLPDTSESSSLVLGKPFGVYVYGC